jgi:hypothetical protein
LTLWEHFRHSGAWDKTHETGYFLHQTRLMLVQERGDELWLAPFVPSAWLRHGQTLTVTNASSRFGPLSFQLRSRLADGFVDAQVHLSTRQLPRELVLRFRHPEGRPLRSAALGSGAALAFNSQDGTVRVPSPAASVAVRAGFK